MRIFIEDKYVVCDLTEPNDRFWRAVNYAWFHFSARNVRRAKIERTDYEYKSLYEAQTDLYTLTRILAFAEDEKVEVAEEVYSYRAELEKTVTRLYQEEKAREEEEKRRREWDSRKTFGCGRCKNLYYSGDDPVCRACGEYLDVKNMPKFDGTVYRLMNLVPLPSDGCPYKV